MTDRAEPDTITFAGRKWVDARAYDSLRTRVEELEIVCAEAYQVVGALASYAGVFCTDDVERALDNLAQRKRVHSDLLPWPKSAAPFLALENTVKRAEQAESDAEWLRARVLR